LHRVKAKYINLYNRRACKFSISHTRVETFINISLECSPFLKEFKTIERLRFLANM